MALETTSGFQHPQALPARLDRLPMSREVWRILLLAGIAWLIESYDVGLIGSLLPSLERAYALTTSEIGLVAIASTLGIVIAIIPAGWLADRVGRKRMLVIGTAWYAVFSLACGLAPSIGTLIALRIVAGLGMGAVFPIPYAIASEFTPARWRGAAAGILDSFLSVGYFLAPLVAFAIIPNVPIANGWRYLFVIGGLPLLFVPVLIKWLPESPRWLAVRGQMSEANRIVGGLEAAIERRSGMPLTAPAFDMPLSPPETAAPKSTFFALFRQGFLKRTIMMWISFSCLLFVFYAIQTYTPSVLIKEGYGWTNAFLITALIVIASIPGKLTEAYLVERFGRKATIISFALIAAASALIFGISHSLVLALTFGALLSFFGIGVDPAIKIYGAEQYPTHMRETGVSCIEGVGRFFGGVLAPFIMAFLLVHSGIAGSYVFVAAMAIVGALVVALLGTETSGITLERVTMAPARDPQAVERRSA